MKEKKKRNPNAPHRIQRLNAESCPWDTEHWWAQSIRKTGYKRCTRCGIIMDIVIPPNEEVFEISPYLSKCDPSNREEIKELNKKYKKLK